MDSYVTVTGPNRETATLVVTDGSVTIDRSATVRRHVTLTCVDPAGTLTPTEADGLLAPYGTEVRPYRGILYDDGTTEVVPLGVFRISQVQVKDSNTGLTITIEGYDRSRVIQRDKFTDTYTVAKATNVIVAIQTILARSFPNLTYDVVDSTLTTSGPMVYDANADPWEACESLAASAGREIFFNSTGGVTISPPVDINHIPEPDFRYEEGEDCIMIDATVTRTDEPGYNGVILTGEATTSGAKPVRSVIWDEDPASLTYHKGPYGEVPMFVQDQTVTNQFDADAAAASQLNAILGYSEQVQITAGVNPAMNVDDVVSIKRAKSGIDSVYAIDSISIPLKANGTSDIDVRQKKVAA